MVVLVQVQHDEEKIWRHCRGAEHQHINKLFQHDLTSDVAYMAHSGAVRLNVDC